MKRTINLLVHGDVKAQGAPVVASLRNVEGRTEQRVIAEIGKVANIAVTPGRWAVEVLLPSGERLREVADVTSAPSAQVRIGARRTPHEWMGFQNMLVRRGQLGGSEPTMRGSLARRLPVCSVHPPSRQYRRQESGELSGTVSPTYAASSMARPSFAARYSAGVFQPNA